MNYSEFRLQQQFFNSSDGKLAYIDKGKGTPLVLLHGIPTSSWLYRKMIDELATSFRVIAPDMLGFGNSDSPKGYDIYNPDQHAKRLLELMDHLKIEHWNHVLHDAGGLWTWELFKIAPHRIQKLIILNTILFKEGFHPPMRFKKGWLTKCIMSMYSNGISTNLMLKGLFNSGLKKNELDKNDIEGYKKPLREGKTKAMYNFFSKTCFVLPDYTSVFENITIPKLVIWGKHDSFLVFDKMKERVYKQISSEENVHILDAKHFIQEEKPKEINDLIIPFLTV